MNKRIEDMTIKEMREICDKNMAKGTCNECPFLFCYSVSGCMVEQLARRLKCKEEIKQ